MTGIGPSGFGPGAGAAEYEALMREAANKIESVKQIGVKLAAVRGTGEAADGKVKVTVHQGGRLEAVDLDPRAMRMASEDLGAAIVEAVAAATEDVTAKAAELMESVLPGAGAGIVGLADPEALAQERENSEARVDAIIQSLRDGMRA